MEAKGSTVGAWGYGPFDSDSALDYLGDLADRVGQLNDEGDLDPASVNHYDAADRLRRAMAAVSCPATPGEYRNEAVDCAYTAAGLVAAVLTGHHGPSTGTTLGDNLPSSDDVHLSLHAHCGYAALLTTEDAADLRQAAQAAVAAIAKEGDWLSGRMVDHVHALAAALASPRAT